MDELAAAAAVVAIATDANAPNDLEQRSFCGNIGDGRVEMLDVETMAEDKENNNVHAAAHEFEDAAFEVASAPPVLIRTPYTQPLTRSCGLWPRSHSP